MSIRLRVSHEALLTHWERAKTQIEKDEGLLKVRRRIETDMRLWEQSGKPTELLLPTGLKLIEAKNLLTAWEQELEGEIQSYIEASLNAEQERQRKERETQDELKHNFGLALLEKAAQYRAQCRPPFAARDGLATVSFPPLVITIQGVIAFSAKSKIRLSTAGGGSTIIIPNMASNFASCSANSSASMASYAISKIRESSLAGGSSINGANNASAFASIAIARNKYYDHLRQQRSGTNYTHEHDDSAEPNSEAEAEKENAEEVQLALDNVAIQMQIGIQHLQSLDGLPENLEPSADFEQQPERQIELQELARLLGEGIALLPRYQQDAFIMRRMGLSLDMIAKIQGVPRETVRARLRAAMRALKEVLEKWRTV